jgi:hypothetical protein
MARLSKARALILDLPKNRGAAASMVDFLCSLAWRQEKYHHGCQMTSTARLDPAKPTDFGTVLDRT